MKKYFVLLLSLLTISAVPLQAQTVIGKYAGEFMATGFGGRALAMGGAAVAAVNDVTAAYWNPAGLMQLNYPEIGLMHEQRFGGLVNFNYGGVAWPFSSKYTLAVSVTRTGVDDIYDTRNALIDVNGNGQLDPNDRIDPSRVTSFNYATWAGYLTYAFKAYDNFNLGVNLKVIHHQLAEANANGIGFDVGALYRPADNLLIGATLQDVTTTLIAWNTGRNELVTPTLKLGGAYTLEALGGTITPAIDVDMMFENRQFASLAHVGPVSLNPHAGFEYQFKGLFALRGGFNDTQNFTFGAGIHFPKLYLDYAYAQSNLLTDFKEGSHRISLRLQLEEQKFARIKTN